MQSDTAVMAADHSDIPPADMVKFLWGRRRSSLLSYTTRRPIWRVCDSRRHRAAVAPDWRAGEPRGSRMFQSPVLSPPEKLAR
jgi:hypothetical protein